MTRTLAILLATLLFLACPQKAPTVPAPPTADIRGDSLAFFTSSTDPGNQPVACVFDWGDGTFDTSAYVTGGDTAWACHDFDSVGTWDVRARAVNALGHWSGWSETTPYTRSKPPYLADTLLGPRWYGRDRWCRFRAVVADGDGDSISARFRWGNGTASAWSLTVAPGDTVLDSVYCAADGIYEVRVDLRDARGTITPSAAKCSLEVSLVAILWHHSGEYCGSATPTLGWRGGELRIYVLREDPGFVTCYRADGSAVWNTPFNMYFQYPPSLSPDGSRLYLTNYDEGDVGLYCLDADDGRVVWSRSDQRYEGTPAIGPNGEVYVSYVETTTLIRFSDDGDSTRVVWELDLPNGLCMSPSPVVAANGTVYVAYSPGECSTRVAAVSPDGQLLWESPAFATCDDDTYSPVIDGNGRIIVVSYYSGVFCYNPDGTLAWHNPGLDCGMPFTTAVGPGNRVYYSDEDFSCLRCISPNGRDVWIADIEMCENWGTPLLLDDGRVLVYDSESELLLVFNSDGELLLEFWADDYVPAKRRQRHPARDEYEEYCSAAIGPDGNLYMSGTELGTWCLSFGDARLATAPWPTYNHDPARSGWAGRQ